MITVVLCKRIVIKFYDFKSPHVFLILIYVLSVLVRNPLRYIKTHIFVNLTLATYVGSSTCRNCSRVFLIKYIDKNTSLFTVQHYTLIRLNQLICYVSRSGNNENTPRNEI